MRTQNERTRLNPTDATAMIRQHVTNHPLLLKVPDAAAMLGVGRSTLYELIQTGDLVAVRIGRSVRIPARAIREYAERLEAEQVGNGGAA